MLLNLLILLDLTFDPSFRVKRGSAIFKGLKTHLLLVLEVWDVKPIYRKSCAVDFFMRSDLNFEVKRTSTIFKRPKINLLLVL